MAVFSFQHDLHKKHEYFLNKFENLFIKQQFLGNETETVQYIVKNALKYPYCLNAQKKKNVKIHFNTCTVHFFFLLFCKLTNKSTITINL